MKSALFTTKIEEIVYNINDAGDASASVSLNPTFAWTKFILTDDQPNENKQRVPKSEFANLIKTGINAPVKMAVGKIEEDHDNAFPLGVITHLKEVDNRIEGMAALWTREREEDIKALREMYANGNLPQLSWEILYQDSKADENGIEDLLDDSLRAVTIVGMPAYAGRTPIFAMASKKSNSEELTVTELEQAQARIKELEDSLAAKDGELTSKASEFTTLNTELEGLRQYKKTVEEEKAAVARFDSIKKKFAEAKIEKPEEYFSENKSFLLGLNDEALDFMIQEFVSFSSAIASIKPKVEIPNIQSNDSGIETDTKKLAEELKKRLKK